MGKQINYWAGYDDFLKIAQAALDCGCIIIKKISGTMIYGQNLRYRHRTRTLLLVLCSRSRKLIRERFSFGWQGYSML